ncbi:divalent metal cation transporter [Aestuariicella hydrocarbonica]|uniref:Divalent metal cation transporter n=1 Tax=Pseudomaricurvus hydrocarbonicus TaxID=1470433 RepID=A0A9E5MPZ8_9GAMM|nr:Nramp family divalent metal transporter [Aestuariicella hydrocarbonica]NHO68368.1 divalent metal cation transporter [Aestuariicella hydrocarbonica]
MRKFGPGLLVMAAFIGPGTVTTASNAGAQYGFALLWALLFSIVATMVLQEMAARLGLVSGQGLAQALRTTFANPLFSRLAVILVVAAIGFGNAAYESGNISGTSMALANVTPIPRPLWAIISAFIAMALLISGRYRIIERALIVLVVVMSLVFVATMFALQPDLGDILKGLLVPSLPQGSLLTVMALIGTTVVPYNLFLHSSSVREKWPEADPAQPANMRTALTESRWDTGLSVSLGGLITLAIVSTAAATFWGTDTAFSSATIAQQLQPVLGPAADYFFAAGLFAAGLTSAITSPLAAAYAVCGAMGWPAQLHQRHFKAVWISVLAAGAIAAATGTRPIAAIIFAQAANGFLLPIIAIFLLVVMNRQDLLGDYRNRWWHNVIGVLVILIVTGLSGFKLWQLLPG